MGCFEFLKFMTFIFNGIIFLGGVANMAVGIWVKVDRSSIFGLIQQSEDMPPELSRVLSMGYLLIALGTVLVIIGFLGCCGAIRESRCMLMLFFVTVMMVFMAQVAGAVVVLGFRPVFKGFLDKFSTNAIMKGYGTQGNMVHQVLEVTMTELNCCGFNNYKDFTGSPYYTANNNKYPPQCCETKEPCDEAAAEKLVTKLSGCFNTLKALIVSNTVLVAAVSLGIAVIEIGAMVVSMTLYHQIG
ncbi:tetraspanin-1-like [Genypterus blacodes]|uniref:tetraspanin-1-like n=1 Tax=Genypterus blacodes TaxID=154954 RepID=UPI003F777EF0